MTYRSTAIITQEGKWFVARSAELGVTSQGKTIEEAQVNLKEAVELYWKKCQVIVLFWDILCLLLLPSKSAVAKTFSGKRVVAILSRSFGFSFVSQKGSHVKLSRKEGRRTITTIVPMHRELARGTLRGALELAEVKEDEFMEVAKK